MNPVTEIDDQDSKINEFLGIMIDEHFNWTDHVKTILSKVYHKVCTLFETFCLFAIHQR